MSGSAELLSRKIRTAKDLGGVVRSMKALAATSIGQYERAVEALDDYLRAVELGMIACLHEASPEVMRGKAQPEGTGTIGAVIFGSDQGLVGSFNEVIVDYSTETLRALPGEVTRIWAIGERTEDLLMEAALSPVNRLAAPDSLGAITPLVGQILLEIESAREEGDLWEVQVFHNRPKGSASYEPVVARLLPLDKEWQESLYATRWPTRMLPQVVDGSPSVLPAFIREYLFVLLFQACAESLASEDASRLASMQRAEKNIDSMMEDLTRRFHRLRQEAIDEELFDVISGFEALTKKKA